MARSSAFTTLVMRLTRAGEKGGTSRPVALASDRPVMVMAGKADAARMTPVRDILTQKMGSWA
eukprot:CAMPEP_0185187792 /NCGR_PEP_ID=MMETSP1140-20130426/4980_1 /TAXON_ID=298111 /ORGANISM="Pavlova sp., Strain CCMP459" /LENGTH=62 /DNA_ID=CAMNT_0027754227 /DNA_START=502 /DNA_END=690 /DNA_ORIENTATION=-